jgi:hypothetical protein
MGSTNHGPLGRLGASARRIPLWARWAITILAFLVVSFVIHNVIHGSEGASGPTSEELRSEFEANREGDVVVEEDQAPHTATLHAGVPARATLERAIAADVRTRVQSSELDGPFQSVRCATSGATHAGRQAYRCTVRSAGIAYTFLAVLDTPARQLTWCKIDPPANGSTAIPVSARCRV